MKRFPPPQSNFIRRVTNLRQIAKEAWLPTVHRTKDLKKKMITKRDRWRFWNVSSHHGQGGKLFKWTCHRLRERLHLAPHCAQWENKTARMKRRGCEMMAIFYIFSENGCVLLLLLLPSAPSHPWCYRYIISIHKKERGEWSTTE